MRPVIYRTPYVQSSADDIDPRTRARASHKFAVLAGELEPLGWKLVLALHDEVEYGGPDAARDQAHEIIARHVMSGERTRWLFELEDGSRISGCVQGCGGIVEFPGGRERLEIAQAMTYCDSDQAPSRRANRIGTVRVVTFPSGGGRARVTHPFTLAEAITFFDPFQAPVVASRP